MDASQISLELITTTVIRAYAIQGDAPVTKDDRNAQFRPKVVEIVERNGELTGAAVQGPHVRTGSLRKRYYSVLRGELPAWLAPLVGGS